MSRGEELHVRDGPAAGRTAAIDRLIVLGRDPSVDLPIADGEMSRRHAQVAATADGVVIEDLGSLNGTFVNGQRVEGTRRLQSGDRIKVGDTTVEYIRANVDDATRLSGRRQGGELRILEGVGELDTIPLAGALTLGRDPSCDVVFADAEISRRHARVVTRADGAAVEDLGSTNGTFVNGERLLGTQALVPGDRIELGSAVLQYAGPSPGVTRVRPTAAPQVTTIREALAQPSRLLSAETGSRKWWTLAVVCVASFMLLVDTTIVAVALPSIHRSLNASLSDLQWVVDAYSASLAAFLLTSGSLSDLIGRRHIFLCGLCTFTIFSALCGLAWSALALDLFRGLQGVGAAMMLGPSSALIAQEFAARERGIAFGILGGITGLAIAVGPLLGGALTDTLGWQSVFYVNLPIGLVAIALTVRRMVNLAGERTRIDYLGLVTFSLALFALVFGLIRGNDEGWYSAQIVASLATAAILLVVFLVIEIRTEHSMIDLRLFRMPTFVGASLAAFATAAAVMALIIYITLWFQSVLGASPLGAGTRLLAMTAPILVLAPVGGRLSGAIPARVQLFAGLACMSGGAFAMASISAASHWTVLVPGLALAGVGLALSSPALSSTAVSIVPPWRTGMASGLNYTWRQLGLVTGIAALGAVFEHQVTTTTVTLLGHSPLAGRSAGLGRVIASGGGRGLVQALPVAVRSTVQRVAESSFATGLSHIFVIAGVVAAAGGLASLALIRRSDVVSDRR